MFTGNYDYVIRADGEPVNWEAIEEALEPLDDLGEFERFMQSVLRPLDQPVML